jgi:hypothetical protein
MCKISTNVQETAPKQYIAIGHKHLRLTLGQYVQVIKRVKADKPRTWYPETLCSWAGGTREDVLREFGELVQDKINEHMVIREMRPGQLNKLKTRHLVSGCRWCGRSLGEYRHRENRFCDINCRQSYYY